MGDLVPWDAVVIYNDNRVPKFLGKGLGAAVKGRSTTSWGQSVQAFDYVSPTSKEQVAVLLGENGSILAGGTDLLALMKDYVVTPRRLVNIKEIEQLRGIRNEPRNGLRIGALTTIAELAEARTELAAYPALLEAANEAASPQIRNLATIGGNMCQRPRCWYFRNGMGLFPKAPNGKSMVVEGDNRYAAILGNDGPAYFVSPSTIAPVLIAYGAVLPNYGRADP
jgi:xanthine dehydrogenase YagS FAD-binding subunit